ncbi:MAG: VanZ family protein [Pontiella sp.]
MRLPAILLLGVSLLFWGFYDRYESVSSLLLDSPDLSEAFLVQGDCSETNGIISLNVPAGGKGARVRFQLPYAPEYKFIRLTGRMRIENVVQGKLRWSCARLLLIQRDTKGKWIPTSHALYAETGTADWVDLVGEFEIIPGAERFEVVLEQVGKSGRADYSNITAQAIRVRASFFWFRLAFTGAWILLGLLYLKRCRLDHRRLRILILLNTMAILFGTLIPSAWISDASATIKEYAMKTVERSSEARTDFSFGKTPKNTISEQDIQRVEVFTDLVNEAHKAGHFVLFGSLCFLVYCSAWLEKQHPVFYLKVVLDILLFAAISEALQYLTNDRQPGVLDWLIDIYGMLLALICFLFVRFVSAVLPASGRA